MPARVEDVSLSGASVVTRDVEVQVGDRVRIDMKIGGRVASIDAVVRQRSRANADGVFRMGVEYEPGQWKARSAMATGLFNVGLNSELVPS